MYNNTCNEGCAIPRAIDSYETREIAPHPPIYELLGKLNEMTMVTLDNAFYIQDNLFGQRPDSTEPKREVSCARDQILQIIERVQVANDILGSIRSQL